MVSILESIPCPIFLDKRSHDKMVSIQVNLGNFFQRFQEYTIR